MKKSKLNISFEGELSILKDGIKVDTNILTNKLIQIMLDKRLFVCMEDNPLYLLADVIGVVKAIEIKSDKKILFDVFEINGGKISETLDICIIGDLSKDEEKIKEDFEIIKLINSHE